MKHREAGEFYHEINDLNESIDFLVDSFWDMRCTKVQIEALNWVASPIARSGTHRNIGIIHNRQPP